MSPRSQLGAGPTVGSSCFACSWKSALFVSDDLGASWKQHSNGLTTHRQADEPRFGAPHFGVIALERADSQRIFVGGFDGLFSATDPAGSWEAVETLAAGIVIDLALSPALDDRFSVAVSAYGAGAALRPELAKPWQIANMGLSTTRLGPLRFSPQFNTDKTLVAGSEGCVLVSRDGGLGWRSCALIPTARSGRSVRVFARVRAAERLASRYLSTGTMKSLKDAFQSLMLRTSGRVSRFVFATVIVFSPDYERDQTIFVGTRANGIFRSQDGGRSFQQLWDCDDRFIYSLVPSPDFAIDNLLFATTSDGLYASRDRGATWRREVGGAFAGALVAISPGFRHDSTVIVGGRRGLYRSSDGGKTWHPRAVTHAGESVIGGLALAPSFAADRTMLVHVRGHGLFRSSDGAETFHPLTWQHDNHDHAFCPLSCFPDSTTLFQFSPRFATDRTVIAACLDRVYASRDAGLTWAALDRLTRYENFRPEIRYCGRWTRHFHGEYSARQAHRSARPLDTATLKFFGTRISWLGCRGPDHGIAKVIIDGELHGSVDLYAPRRMRGCELFAASLPRGRHSIAVQIQRERNTQSGGRTVTIDAFDVHLEGEAPTQSASSRERSARSAS